MNIKKILFFAIFALVVSTSLFAKKMTNSPKISGKLDAKTLQSTLWEVVSIDNDIYPTCQDGILMHMYFIFSNDGNMYIGCKFEKDKDSALGFGNKSMKYELKGKGLVIADTELEILLDKENRLILRETGDDEGDIVLKPVNSPSIEELKNAETMDLGDIF